ncbi:MAG: LPS export ABC transporter periplasmic protein LptC [Gemmatimonadota bacterium]|nr:LPS export ABC transporter periplasmic protein LptC [Gemmatimonadota bacterium]
MNRRALLVAMTVMLAACRTKGAAPPVEGHATLADSAEQMLVTTRSLLVDRGVQRGEMFADTVYVFDDNTRFEMRKVRVVFNTATGGKDGTMSADRGTYNQRNGTLEGFGNVVLVSNDGKRLTSPQLKYSQAINEVSSDTSFTLVEPGKTVSGIGLRADPQMTRVKVLRNFGGKGSFTLPGQ